MAALPPKPESTPSLQQKRDTIRQIFDSARKMREGELAAVCLKRLITLSEALEDTAATRYYRTLQYLLQPVLQASSKLEIEPHHRSTNVLLPSPPAAISSFPEETPCVLNRQIPKSLPPNLPTVFERCIRDGWLPYLETGNCILWGRSPFLTPAEICHFAEGRTGILFLMSEIIQDHQTWVPPLPAVALIFNGSYRGAWQPYNVPPSLELDNLVIDTIALWQIESTPGWSAFLEMSPAALKQFQEETQSCRKVETISFSQALFYRLTDIETSRAHYPFLSTETANLR